jgi:hypothetical protein
VSIAASFMSPSPNAFSAAVMASSDAFASAPRTFAALSSFARASFMPSMRTFGSGEGGGTSSSFFVSAPMPMAFSANRRIST